MSAAKSDRVVVQSDEGTSEMAVASRGTPLGLPMLVYQAVLGIGILAAWQLISGRLVKEIFVSSPVLVAERLVELFFTGEIWLHLQVTMVEFGMGYLIGAVGGVVLGVGLARTQFLAGVLEPYFMAFYSIPRVALAPLFIIWLGIDISPKIAISAVSAFFLVFVNSFAGIRNINEELVNLALLMGATRSVVIRRVLLPSAAPEILLGLRSSVPYAMIGAVIGEFIASNRGLGWLMLRSSQLFDTSTLFAAILVNVGLVIAVTQALTAIQRRLIRWQVVTETRVEV